MIVNYLKHQNKFIELLPKSDNNDPDEIGNLTKFLREAEFKTLVRNIFFKYREVYPQFRLPKNNSLDWFHNHFALSFDNELVLDYGNVYIPNSNVDEDCYNSFLFVLDYLNPEQDAEFILKLTEPSDRQLAYGCRIYNPLLGQSGRNADYRKAAF